jgi:hypothetical protein
MKRGRPDQDPTADPAAERRHRGDAGDDERAEAAAGVGEHLVVASPL